MKDLFGKRFQCVDKVERSLAIIEIECMRAVCSFNRDVQSTLLWDKSVEFSGHANPRVFDANEPKNSRHQLFVEDRFLSPAPEAGSVGPVISRKALITVSTTGPEASGK